MITFQYDYAYRLEHLRATTIGADVDDAMKRITYTYSDAGRLEKITSYDHLSHFVAKRLNEVEFSYTGFGQLEEDRQAHAGSASSGSPKVTYAYDYSDPNDIDSSNANSPMNFFDRLQNITYPNGRVVWYDYHHETSGLATLDYLLSRVGQIADDDSGSKGKIFTQYDFNGLGRLVRRDHLDTGSGSGGKPGNQTAMTLLALADGLMVEGPDYRGLDQFGRITGLRHLDYSAAGDTVDDLYAPRPVDLVYGYDRNSNVTEILSYHNYAFSRKFTYDNLNRLINDENVFTDGSGDTLSERTSPREQAWELDILGNWDEFNRAVNDDDNAETRGHNATNEITTLTVAPEPARYVVDDDFTDNDTTGYEVGEIASGSDGSWSASSGTLACTETVTVSGAPGGGSASMLLVEGADFQDFAATCDVNVSSGTPTVGLVFGYLDVENYWLRIYEAGGTSNNVKVYQRTSAGFTLKDTASHDLSGSSFSMAGHVYAGTAASYDDDFPAGQVGIYSDSTSGVTFDNFQIRDKVGPYAVDGRWVCSQGYTTVDDGDSNQLQIGGSSAHRHAVYTGFRGSKYQAEFDFTWQRDPIDDDPNDGNLQRLRFWIDTNDDDSFTDSSPTELFLSTTAIDDVWDGGRFGFFRNSGDDTVTQKFDNLVIQVDADGDDTYDDEVVSLDFDSAAITLTHDDNGNLTGDGTFTYTWDAENRLTCVQSGDPNSPANGDKKVDFVYDYMGRRAEKKVSTHNGTSWSVSDCRRFVWSDWLPVLEYEVTDPGDPNEALTIIHKNTWGLDLGGTGDSPVIDTASGIGGLLATEDVADTKDYYYLYDANGNVGQLLDASDGSIAAKYEYDPYGNNLLDPNESGLYAADNLFRFSTKYLDDETGLGYRELPRAVTLTGPRQSGESTPCRMVFPKHGYANLEARDVRAFTANDARGFLSQFNRGAGHATDRQRAVHRRNATDLCQVRTAR